MPLTDEQKALRDAMRMELRRKAASNQRLENYAEGKFKVKNLNIAVPPSLADIGTVSDWPGTIVDAYHERMNFEGWGDGGRFGMTALADQLGAQSAVAESTHDSLLFGVGFHMYERQQDGLGVRWVLRSVSPMEGTLLWDAGAGLPLAALRQSVVQMTDGSLGVQEVMAIRGHNLVIQGGQIVDSYPTIPDLVVAAPMKNKLRSRKWTGRSLVTPAVQYYTDAATRTLLGMEINREFYTTPQRWAMNADMTMFTESDEPTRSEMIEAGWKAAAGKMLAFPPNEKGEPEPKVGQFSPAPPSPYVEQLRTYSQLISSATGMPSAYLGFSTDNPPSGDAIRAWMERLTRGIGRMHRLTHQDMNLVGWMGLRLEMGTQAPSWAEFASVVRPKWEDPSTQTLAADTDAVSKAVAAGSTAPDDDWVYDRLRVPERDREAMRSRLRQGGLSQLAEILKARPPAGDPVADELANLGAPAPVGGEQPPVEGVTELERMQVLKVQADALGVLRRGGVTAESAAKLTGLEGVEFEAGRPITLRYDDEGGES